MASRCIYVFPIVLDPVTSRINDEERQRRFEEENDKDRDGRNQQGNACCWWDELKSVRSQTLVKKVEWIVNTPVRRNSVIVAQTALKISEISVISAQGGTEIGLLVLDFENRLGAIRKNWNSWGEKCGNIRPGARVSCHSRDCTSVSHQERNAPFSQRPFDISRTRRKGSLIFDDDATVLSASASLTLDIGVFDTPCIGIHTCHAEFRSREKNHFHKNMSLRSSY